MTGTATSVPSARALRGQLRRARRRSGAAKPIGQTLQDLYVTAFAVVMVAVTVAPTASQVLGDIGSRTASPGLALSLAVAALVAASSAALRALATVGPVVRDPADVTWLLASPARRGSLLAPTAALLLVAAGAVGAVVGAACGVIAAASVGTVLAWAAGGTASFVAVSGLAVLTQRGERVNRRARQGADVGAVVAGLLLVAGLAGLTPRPFGAPWLAAAVLMVLAASALLAVPRALRRLRRSELVAGAGLALGLRATVTALDGSFLAETLRTRRLLERAVVRARPLAGEGLLALVVADARRITRSPRALLAAAALVPVAWTLADLYGDLGAAAAVSVAAWAAAAQVAAGLRTVSRAAAVARCLPFSNAQLRAAHAVLPALVALAVAAATTALTQRPAWTALASALIGTAAVLRSAAGRPPLAWGVQATSPLGSLPVGAITSYLVGLDVAVLATLPLLLGAGPRLSIGVPAAACALLMQFNRRPT